MKRPNKGFVFKCPSDFLLSKSVSYWDWLYKNDKYSGEKRIERTKPGERQRKKERETDRQVARKAET